MDTKRNLFKKFGNTLLGKGKWFLSRAFGIETETIMGGQLENIVANKTTLDKNRIWRADNYYYYTDLKTVKDILKYDLIDQEEYKDKGRRDCDKFAVAIYNRFRWIYGLNTMALARWTAIKDAETGKEIGAHRANVFVAEDKGKLKVFYFEPQTDDIVELNGEKEIHLFEKIYELNVLDF